MVASFWSFDIIITTVPLGSTQSVISGVQAGLGISFVSNFAVKPLVEAKLLKSIPIKGLTLERDLFIVHQKHSLTTKLQQTFFKFSKGWQTQSVN